MEVQEQNANMFPTTSTQSMILCCMCGTPITPNTSNMCGNCLATKVDITEGISKQLIVHHCRGCDRYLRPPWTQVKPESKELMALLLRKIRGLKKVKLIDANFIWTEPHSKRIKVKLKVQKEQFTKLVLQQEFIVEYVVANQFCEDCHRNVAGQTWKAVVQVRQKVSHKKTFLFLEQLILKHNAHDATLQIKTLPDGIDFFFAQRSHALRFIDFVSSIMSVRSKVSKQLVSADLKNNDYNYKFSYMVEIVPVCKHDLMAIPKTLANNIGTIPSLTVCDRIGTTIQVVDPLSGQTAEFDSIKYWKTPFRPFAVGKQLIECVVIDIQPCGDDVTKKGNAIRQRRMVKVKRRRATHAGLSNRSKKYKMVYVEVAKASDLGVNDERCIVKSHLGNILKIGDSVLAYDTKNIVYNDADVEPIMGKRGGEPDFPDYVLVKKFYPSRRVKEKRMKRIWQLHSLAQSGANVTNMDVEDEGSSGKKKKKSGKDRQSRRVRDVLARGQVDYEHFLQDLEEDPELRSRINLYSKPNVVAKANAKEDGDDATMDDNNNDNNSSEDEEDDFPEIQLNELLDGLTLSNNNNNNNNNKVSSVVDDNRLTNEGSTTFNLANVTVLPPTYTLNENAEVVNDDVVDENDL